MLLPRYGPPCSCPECLVAGVGGQRTIEVKPGVLAHGRDLARLYAAIQKFQALNLGPKTMPSGPRKDSE
jgi:hypothetical protein